MLYGISEKLNHRKNGFIRLMPSHAVLVQNEFTFNTSGCYIAGLTENQIFLGSYRNPSQIILLSMSLKDTQDFSIAPPNTKMVWWTVKVKIDSPEIYLMDGISKLILYSQFSNLDKPISISVPVNFDEFTPLSSGNFALRTYNSQVKRNILAKVKHGFFQVENAFSALEPQEDGVFSTDGILLTDPRRQVLVYVYFYRNQFICMDSNLNVKYQGHTIDTNSIAKLKIKSYESGKSHTLAAPPILVNSNSFVSSGKIFIHSSLLANNEEKKLFNQASVIDVYSLSDGHYINSFYLPDHNGHKISDFAVSDNNVIVLYPDGIILASLHL